MFSFRLIKRWTLFQLCTSPVIDKTAVYTICIYTLSRAVSFAISGEVSGYIATFCETTQSYAYIPWQVL